MLKPPHEQPGPVDLPAEAEPQRPERRRSRSGLAAAGVLVLLVAAALAAPWVTPLHLRLGSQHWRISAEWDAGAPLVRPIWASAPLQLSPPVDYRALQLGRCRYKMLIHDREAGPDGRVGWVLVEQ